ncbi:hypothetical protein Tco_0265030 [Tanacetum coccineum]
MHTASSWIRRNVDTEVFREILQICPSILNQDFIAPPSEEELVTFIQELGYSGRINLHTIRDESLLDTLKFVSKTQDYQQYGALIPDDRINQDIKDSQAYKTYYDFATRKVPPRKARKYKKKSTAAPTAGVAIRDTPGVSVSKKKAPAKADRSKGIEILSDVALSKAAQLKEATKRSKKDNYISQESGSGDETDFELGGDSEDDNDDGSDDDSKGDDDKADKYDEEKQDEEYESDMIMKFVEYAHVTLTSSQKIESLKQSSYVSFDFASKFLILENVPPAVDEVASMMNVKNR